MDNSYVKLGATAIGAIIVAATIFGSWYKIDEGDRGVLLTAGKLTAVSAPGLNFKIPFLQDIRVISVRNEVKTFEDMMTYTYDQQTAKLRVSVNYQIEPTDVTQIYSLYGDVEGAISRVLNPRVYESVKNVFGQYTAQRAVQERGKLNGDITVALQAALQGSGVQITSFQIENIDYTEAYESAVEAAAKAKADIERAKSELARVEQEAQQKVKQAEAEATAKKLQADADAYATEAAGKATANAIRERGAALRDNPDLVNLVAAEKWNGVLPTSMIPGSSVPFIDLTPKNTGP